MGKRHRTISTLLILGICLIFSMDSAYSNCNRILETDFITLGVKFEASDIDSLWIDKQTHLVFIPGKTLAIVSPEKDLHRFHIIFFPSGVFIDSPFSVLRC